jgi:hypothetical protein
VANLGAGEVSEPGATSEVSGFPRIGSSLIRSQRAATPQAWRECKRQTLSQLISPEVCCCNLLPSIGHRDQSIASKASRVPVRCIACERDIIRRLRPLAPRPGGQLLAVTMLSLEFLLGLGCWNSLFFHPSDAHRDSESDQEVWNTVALKSVSLEVQSQELFFLLGPSGCGKRPCCGRSLGFYQPTRETCSSVTNR